jgi:hypothetical protein
MDKSDSDYSWIVYLFNMVGKDNLWRVKGDPYMNIPNGRVFKHTYYETYTYILNMQDYSTWLKYSRVLIDFDKDLEELLNE